MTRRIGALVAATCLALLLAAPAAQACAPILMPPSGSIAATPASPEAGQKVMLEATAVVAGTMTTQFPFMINPADPAAGTICLPGAPTPLPVDSYTWNFGDGSPNATGSSVEHTFAAAGDRVVTLTLGAGGTTATATRTLTIKAKSEPPVVPVVPVVPVTPTGPATTDPGPAATPPVAAPAAPATTPARRVQPSSVYCAKASKRRPRRGRPSPYGQCVAALARLRSGRAKTAPAACRTLSRRRYGAMKRTPYGECVVAGRALLADAAAARA